MPFGWSPRWRKGSAPSHEESREQIRTETVLDCELDLGTGQRASGKVVDLTIHGARVRIIGVGAGPLAPEQAVDLTIHGPKNAWHVTTRARVRHLREDREGPLHVGIAFEDLGFLYSQLENALSVYFNRRSSRRYSTTHEPGFAAKLKLGRSVESARMSDLSSGGACVQLSSFQAGPFVTGSNPELRFLLPGTNKELSGTVTVRHRRREGAIESLGLQFDRTEPKGFARNSEAITRYVQRLQERMEKALRSRSA